MNNNINTTEKRIPKILLMGKAGVGKTSMRSIIFANCAPRDAFVLGITHEVNESRLKFMGNLTLNLLDCGGQLEYYKQYFDSKKEQIFSNVEVLVFVIEAEKRQDKQKNNHNTIDDLLFFENCIKALEEFSKNVKIFVLIHKMDMVSEARKKIVYEKRYKEISDRVKSFPLKCFATSIWEFSLYKAWTEIVSSLIIDMDMLKSSLNMLAEACNAEEVIVFERSTFLLTCHYCNKENPDDQRFERISHIIKKFKLSCLNSKKQFDSMTIKAKNFTTYLNNFTKSTYIMMIFNNTNSNLEELVKLNIAISKKSFETIIDKITC